MARVTPPLAPEVDRVGVTTGRCPAPMAAATELRASARLSRCPKSVVLPCTISVSIATWERRVAFSSRMSRTRAPICVTRASTSTCACGVMSAGLSVAATSAALGGLEAGEGRMGATLLGAAAGVDAGAASADTAGRTGAGGSAAASAGGEGGSAAALVASGTAGGGGAGAAACCPPARRLRISAVSPCTDGTGIRRAEDRGSVRGGAGVGRAGRAAPGDACSAWFAASTWDGRTGAGITVPLEAMLSEAAEEGALIVQA